MWNSFPSSISIGVSGSWNASEVTDFCVSASVVLMTMKLHPWGGRSDGGRAQAHLAAIVCQCNVLARGKHRRLRHAVGYTDLHSIWFRCFSIENPALVLHSYNFIWSNIKFILSYCQFLYNIKNGPITAPARSKAWNVFACSNAGIVGSNPTQGWMSLRLFCVCVVLCR
jgi:hypothetical protein